MEVVKNALMNQSVFSYIQRLTYLGSRSLLYFYTS